MSAHPRSLHRLLPSSRPVLLVSSRRRRPRFLLLPIPILVVVIATLCSSMMSRAAALSTSSAASKAAASSSSSSRGRPATVIHWFRHADLRLHDNPALCRAVEEAAAASSSSQPSAGLLPIFCFDPRIFGNDARSPFGSLKCGPRRAQFVLESVANLRSNLERKGSGLVVAHGKPEEVFRTLLERADPGEKKTLAPRVYCQEEVASEELNVDKKVRAVLRGHSPQLGGLETVWGSTMYDPADLPFNDGVMGIPDTFTPFRNKVEKKCEIGSPLKVPSESGLALPKEGDAIREAVNGGGALEKCSLSYMPTLKELGYSPDDIDKVVNPDPRGVMGATGGFKGGETAALARLKEYIWDKDLLKTYFDTRNGMLGSDYSTKFSPWLAHGCLSPRQIAKECRRYEATRIQNKSTYWVVFELLWRDYYKFFALKQGDNIFKLDGTLGSDARGSHPNSRRWGLDRRTVSAWTEGRTGYPLVDANMRELAATGFQSNRGRQNVASFLALDTNTDWRYGADHFEQELLDYDVYSNWGNWCAAAGMTGGRVNRFNIVKQSKDYDQKGEYVKHWLPELKDVPIEFVHEPWKMSKAQQEQYGVRLGVDYPNPIVEPFAPSKKGGRRDSGGGGGRGGGGKNNGRGGGRGGKRGRDNPNRGRGQKQDMKSLKEGTFQFKG